MRPQATYPEIERSAMKHLPWDHNPRSSRKSRLSNSSDGVPTLFSELVDEWLLENIVHGEAAGLAIAEAEPGQRPRDAPMTHDADDLLRSVFQPAAETLHATTEYLGRLAVTSVRAFGTPFIVLSSFGKLVPEDLVDQKFKVPVWELDRKFFLRTSHL